MGSYLKHMVVVIFSSCVALPPGYSLFGEEERGEKEKENFHMLTFTQWFLLIALYFLICPGLMLLKAGLQVFYWSHASRWTNFFAWLLWPCSLTPSYLTECVIAFIPYVKHATQHLDMGCWRQHTDWASFLQVPSSKDYHKLMLLALSEGQSQRESCLKERLNWKRRWSNRYTLLSKAKGRMWNRS